jgi:hypothetical protein
VTDDDVLTRLARTAAPEVLADALARAREQAVARLADRLTDTLIAEALATPALPPPAPPPAAPVPSPEPPSTAAAPPEPPPTAAATPATALYAYAITRAGVPVPAVPPLAGGGELAQVADADLALLVSPVDPARLRVDQDDLSEDGPLAALVRGHDAVLTAAAAAGPVLPLRFGTLVPDEAAAHRLLATHAATARTQLERIGNAREWGVRLVRTLAVDPVPASAGAEVSGTEFLSRRRLALTEAERAGAAAERAAGRLEEALEPHTRACLRRGGSPGSSLLLDLAFLVEPDSEAAVTAALEQLAADEAANGLALELSGPWPPYSFASLTEEVPGGA